MSCYFLCQQYMAESTETCALQRLSQSDSISPNISADHDAHSVLQWRTDWQPEVESVYKTQKDKIFTKLRSDVINPELLVEITMWCFYNIIDICISNILKIISSLWCDAGTTNGHFGFLPNYLEQKRRSRILIKALRKANMSCWNSIIEERTSW